MPPPYSGGARNTRPPRPRLTHFLALTSSALTPPHSHGNPPTNPPPNPLVTAYNRFRAIATSPPHNIPPEAIRPLGTMHFTLGVMTLADENHIQEAKKAMREAVEGYKLEREKDRERMGGVEGGDVGTGVGGVRVKLVGLRTFDPYPEEKQGKGERGKVLGSSSGNNNNSSSRTGASVVEQAEAEEDDRPSWEKHNQSTTPSNSQNTKPDYSKCKILWVEPLDADIPTNSTTISTSQTPSLYPLSLFLKNYFRSQNFLSISPKEEDQPLTLHLTVLNAVYAKRALEGAHGEGGRGTGGRGTGGRGTGGRGTGGRGTGGRGRGGGANADRHKVGYDVRGLVKEFENVVWVDNVLFDRVELMRMGEVKGEMGSESEGESWYESVESVEL